MTVVRPTKIAVKTHFKHSFTSMKRELLNGRRGGGGDNLACRTRHTHRHTQSNQNCLIRFSLLLQPVLLMASGLKHFKMLVMRVCQVGSFFLYVQTQHFHQFCIFLFFMPNNNSSERRNFFFDVVEVFKGCCSNVSRNKVTCCELQWKNNVRNINCGLTSLTMWLPLRATAGKWSNKI